MKNMQSTNPKSFSWQGFLIACILCSLLFWAPIVLFDLNPLSKYLILALGLFCFGLYGILTCKSLIKVLICAEILLNSAVLNLLAFAHFIDPSMVRGQVFALFVLAIAAAEVVIGLALIILIYSQRKSCQISQITSLKN